MSNVLELLFQQHIVVVPWLIAPIYTLIKAHTVCNYAEYNLS